MPPQKPGRSKQDYGTPPKFLQAVMNRLGITDFTWDLAASDENTVTENGWFTEADNALTQEWPRLPGWLWLNPPFADIYPWAQKAYESSLLGCRVAMLVPLSIAEWWTDYVDNKAYVLMLHGRITFVGEDKPYPKDCALVLYGPEGYKGYEAWSWK
jgi:phage N-6-adenine-methyltransferase